MHGIHVYMCTTCRSVVPCVTELQSAVAAVSWVLQSPSGRGTFPVTSSLIDSYCGGCQSGRKWGRGGRERVRSVKGEKGWGVWRGGDKEESADGREGIVLCIETAPWKCTIHTPFQQLLRCYNEAGRDEGRWTHSTGNTLWPGNEIKSCVHYKYHKDWHLLFTAWADTDCALYHARCSLLADIAHSLWSVHSFLQCKRNWNEQ